MRKYILTLLCVVLLFAGCVKAGDIPAAETPTETSLMTTETPTATPYATPEMPTDTPQSNTPSIEPSITPIQHTYETPPQEPPVILPELQWGEKIDEYSVDYVYFTDRAKTIPLTHIKTGDTFLNLYAESVDAYIEEYDDGSIAYDACMAKFSGEIEVKARIEFRNGGHIGEDGAFLEYDEDDLWYGVFVYIDEESYPLIPKLVNYEDSGSRFKLWKSDVVDRLIAEEFDGEAGIIEDCRIVIKDPIIWYGHTEGYDMAEFVELIKD